MARPSVRLPTRIGIHTAPYIPTRGPRGGMLSSRPKSTRSGSGLFSAERKNGVEISRCFHCSGTGPHLDSITRPQPDSPRRSPASQRPARSADEVSSNDCTATSSTRSSGSPRAEARSRALVCSAGMPELFHLRIQPDADIISPSIKKLRLQDQIAEQQRGADRRNGGKDFANQTIVQEIAAQEHDSLLRFILHRSYQCLKSRKTQRISKFPPSHSNSVSSYFPIPKLQHCAIPGWVFFHSRAFALTFLPLLHAVASLKSVPF